MRLLRPPYFVACNSCNQVVTRVQQLCYRADTTLLQLLQATKLPGVLRPQHMHYQNRGLQYDTYFFLATVLVVGLGKKVRSFVYIMNLQKLFYLRTFVLHPLQLIYSIIMCFAYLIQSTPLNRNLVNWEFRK